MARTNQTNATATIAGPSSIAILPECCYCTKNTKRHARITPGGVHRSTDERPETGRPISGRKPIDQSARRDRSTTQLADTDRPTNQQAKTGRSTIQLAETDRWTNQLEETERSTNQLEETDQSTNQLAKTD